MKEISDIKWLKQNKARAKPGEELENINQPKQSGKKTWIVGVCGPRNRKMRWLMVQCAHSACRYDPRLRRLYKRHSRRKGGKSAVVAVANEMAHIMYFILKRNEPYRGVNRGL